MECVYLIRDNESGYHKIGMTTNWDRRARELKVGTVTTKVRVVACKNAKKWERVLQAMFKHKQMPQSEWFRITADEAIPKMEWLAAKTNQKLVIGKWKRAKAGHYYRRRMSSFGNWYTEQKSSVEIEQEELQLLELEIKSVESIKIKEARREPGYWPSKKDPNVIVWAKKDPTYNSSDGWMVLVIVSVILALLFGQPLLLIISFAAILFGLKK